MYIYIHIYIYIYINFMAPFYGWASIASTSRKQLLSTTKFPEIASTHFTSLERIKG